MAKKKPVVKTNSKTPAKIDAKAATSTNSKTAWLVKLRVAEEADFGKLYQLRMEAELVLDKHRARLLNLPMVNG